MATEPAHTNDRRDSLNFTRRGWRRRATAIGLGLLFAPVASLLLCGLAGGATLPAGFTEQTIGSGWSEAVGLTFAPDGRTFVWERGGRVWTIENGVKSAQPILDIHDEVGGWRDFGLLGFCLDPNFSNNGHVYLLYVVDHHHLANFGTANYNANTDEYFRATIGRITRYTARASDGFRSIDYSTRRVLVGETITSGFPILHESHGVGALVFGADGTLMASCGDGASYSLTDTGSANGTYYAAGLSEGIIRSKENIGALRSQLVDSLSGKIIRIDPATGDAVSSNPFYQSGSPRSARSRVWALGLRNPCRMTLRAGSGSHNPADANPGVLYIGDVGWSTWEDLNVCTGPGQNFGWPLYEGMTSLASYYNANVFNQDAPNPLNGTGGCSQQFFYFRDLLKQASLNPPSWPNPCNTSQQIPATIPRFVHTRPAIDWNHAANGPSRTGTYDASGNATVVNLSATGSPVPGPNFGGNCSIGAAWYDGNDFPSSYKNTYFNADYGQGWIRNFSFDANNKPVSVRDFATGGGGVVFVGTHPTEGALYYISWATTVRKILYAPAGNQPPVSTPVADKVFGASPLTVQFTGTNSVDPEGTTLTYNWNFGDGTTNNTANPSHVFSVPGGVVTNFIVRLIVWDGGNATGTNTLKIHLNNTPPVIAITSPTNGTRYPMTSDTIYPLTASVGDAEHPSNQLSYDWQTFLHHNDHQHQEQVDTNVVSSTTISPVGCGTETYYYRVRLTVTDPAGLAGTAEALLYPDCPAAPPTISDIPDQGTAVNTPTAGLPFTIGDADTPIGNLTLSSGSSNPTLVPNGNIVFGGSGASRTVTVTPAAGQTGTAIITVSVSDGALAASNAFTLTVSDQPAGLVAAYGFNEGSGATVADVSGNANNGTTGSATWTAAGRYGNALSFTGSSAHVTVNDSASLDLTTGMTLEAWVYPTAGGGWRDVIYKGVDDIYYLMGSSDTGAPAVGGTFVPSPLRGAAGLPLNTWTHLAGTYDGANLRLFTNGVQVASQTQTGAIQTSTAALTIGGDTLYGQYFAGRIDEVRLYNRALSTAEIQADMNTPVGGNPPSRPPTISDIANQATTVNTPTAAIPFTIADVDTPVASLTLGGGSSNTSLVPTNNIVFGGSSSNRTVTVTPATGQTGTATITVTVSDGTNSASDTFLLTVNVVNTPPTISTIPNQIINEDNSTGPVAFTIGDAETAAGSLTLGKASSDLTLVPVNNIVFGGSGANRTVTVTPAANQSGSATITVTVSDGQYSAGTNFTVTVNAVNDVPTSSGIANQTIGLDSTTGPLGFTVGDVETAAGSLAVSGGSTDLALVPVNNIVFGGSGASRTLTVTPAVGQSGTVTITLTVNDGQLATNTSFVLTVSSLVTGTRSFTNAAATTIPDSGVASLYPSTINVSGLGGTVSNVTVSLLGLSHTRPDDIDVLLVGPGGQKAILFADVGGANALANINVTLSDTGSGLPNNNRINTGTYRPSNFSPADAFPSPAPASPYSGSLSAFNGQTPNGAWSLYVFDDLAGSSGSLANGWSLTMTTGSAAAPAANVTSPGPITITSITFIDPGQLRLAGFGDADVTYTVETSSDLIQWDALGQTRADGAGAFEFVDDLAGGFNARFYRVTMP